MLPVFLLAFSIPVSAYDSVAMGDLPSEWVRLIPTTEQVKGCVDYPIYGRGGSNLDDLPWRMPAEAVVESEKASKDHSDFDSGIEAVLRTYSIREEGLFKDNDKRAKLWEFDLSVIVRCHWNERQANDYCTDVFDPDRVEPDAKIVSGRRGLFVFEVGYSTRSRYGTISALDHEEMRKIVIAVAKDIDTRLLSGPLPVLGKGGPMMTDTTNPPVGIEIVDGPRGDPNPVEGGGTVRCRVQAQHPDKLPLQYQWTATSGSFDDPTLPDPTWTTPQGGVVIPNCTLSVSIRSGDGLEATDSFVVQIGEAADLHTEAEWISLTFIQPNSFMEIEREADRQFVIVQIENRHSTAIARNAFIQLSAGPQQADGNHVGPPVSIGDIPPLSKQVVPLYWDLKGANIENYRLYADVYCKDQPDLNPDDNHASIDIEGIYYAHNGTRAFNFAEDTFSHENYGMRSEGVQKLIKKMAALIVSGLDQTQPNTPLVDDPLHMLLYHRYETYLKKFEKSGAGGQCHGFIHAAKDHFERPGTRPLPKKVSDLSKSEAASTIAIYHTTQMLQLGPAILTNSFYQKKEFAVSETLKNAESALKTKRECIKIALHGYKEKEDGKQAGTWGHAILGYKLIKVSGRNPVLYVYDPNRPFTHSTLQQSQVMSQVVFDSDAFSMPDHMNAIYRQPSSKKGIRKRCYRDGIAAVPSLRELDPSAVNASAMAANAAIYSTALWMQQNGLAGHILRCPADAQFVDSQGRRTGLIDGELVNEIPGAETHVVGDAEVYFLPQDKDFHMIITGTDTGQARFASVRGVTDTRIGVDAYVDIPLRFGTRIEGELIRGGKVSDLTVDGKEFSRSVEGYLDQDDSLWSGQGGGSSSKPTMNTEDSTPRFLSEGLYEHYQTPAQVMYIFLVDPIFSGGDVTRVGSPEISEKMVSIDFDRAGETEHLRFLEKSNDGQNAEVLVAAPRGKGTIYRLQRIENRWAILEGK